MSYKVLLDHFLAVRTGVGPLAGDVFSDDMDAVVATLTAMKRHKEAIENVLKARARSGSAAGAGTAAGHTVTVYAGPQQQVTVPGATGAEPATLAVSVGCPAYRYLLSAEARPTGKEGFNAAVSIAGSSTAGTAQRYARPKQATAIPMTVGSRSTLAQQVTVTTTCLGAKTDTVDGHWHLLAPPTEQQLATLVDGGKRRTAAPSCPAGSATLAVRVVSTGRLRTQSSYPTANGWQFETWNQTSEQAAAATLVATCLPTRIDPTARKGQSAGTAPAGLALRVTSAESAPASVAVGAAVEARAACPAGSNAVGGGWKVLSGTVAADGRLAGDAFAVCLGKRTTGGG